MHQANLIRRVDEYDCTFLRLALHGIYERLRDGLHDGSVGAGLTTPVDADRLIRLLGERDESGASRPQATCVARNGDVQAPVVPRPEAE